MFFLAQLYLPTILRHFILCRTDGIPLLACRFEIRLICMLLCASASFIFAYDVVCLSRCTDASTQLI